MPREDYIVTIGLEVHCQVKTASKMFCSCPTSFGDDPNSNVCPTCMGMPGALPVLNKTAIEKTILAGVMIDGKTPEISTWDRKNYFYPDMPKDYQTTQMDFPLVIGGEVPLYDICYPKDAQKNIINPDKKVILNRIHLEEDVAKSTHQAKNSLIDFNRAGTPLMEIVTEPVVDSAEEAYAFIKSLQQILIYGDISDADMEKGQLRCDVNISIRPKGQEELGPRCELKNLNSTSAVRRAIHYEVDRQVMDADNGILQIQSTRRWDDAVGESTQMRTKEDAHDYRYFPCPDLQPIETADLVKAAIPKRPELPHEKRARFVEQYQVSDYDAGVLISERSLATYFEKAADSSSVSGKKIANWIINTVLGLLNIEGEGASISDCPVAPEKVGLTAQLVEDNICSNNQAKEVFAKLWENPELIPADIAKELGFEPADTSALDGIIDGIIAENPEKVAEIQGGNPKLANWLTGQVMKASKGKANAKVVTGIIQQKLGL